MTSNKVNRCYFVSIERFNCTLFIRLQINLVLYEALFHVELYDEKFGFHIVEQSDGDCL